MVAAIMFAIAWIGCLMFGQWVAAIVCVAAVLVAWEASFCIKKIIKRMDEEQERFKAFLTTVKIGKAPEEGQCMHIDGVPDFDVSNVPTIADILLNDKL